ncbi:MAG: phospholipid carrier-dependent glycosyltransferase [Candidatus Bathyarchaeia archaeon]
MKRVAWRDLTAIIVISSIFFLTVVWNLGATSIPLTLVECQTSGGEGFYMDLGYVKRIYSFCILLKKTTDFISFRLYTHSPEDFLCAMKTGVDGFFYMPNVTNNVLGIILKIELLFNDENLVGDQAGGNLPFSTMTAYPDGKVDSIDIQFIERYNGGNEVGELWDYMADIVPDKTINETDLRSANANLGKNGTYITDLTEVKVKFDTGEEKAPDIYGFIPVPAGATSFNVTRDGNPIGAMVTFWYARLVFMDGYYCWKEVEVNAETRYIGFVFYASSGEMAEIAVIDEEAKIVPIKSIEGVGINNDVLRNLVDEQGKIVYPPTYMYEAYFDETGYFVRAAEEYAKLEKPYGVVHPPLGKLIIAAGILIFGCNPFGWRIMNVVFATLTIPVIYVLSKRMFRTWIAASIAAFLLVFEFMHFTMARIATVEVYVVFFSLTSHLFFFAYLQGVLQKKADNRLLFLAVLFFALGFSTKWIALFGFLGDVFLLLVLRLKELSTVEAGWSLKAKTFLIHTLLPLAGFLAIAVAIYFLTFLPFIMVGYTLGDVYNLQWNMYNYHATLRFEHSSSSPWWSWPIIQTPVLLYASPLLDPMVSTIVCMGNPAIWWFGALCIILIIAKAFLEKKNFVYAYVVTIFLFQWLLYALISRPLFLYNFYSNVPFLILAVTLILNELWESKSFRHGKLVVSAYMFVVVIFFLTFYPVISGQPCPYTWEESLRWFETWNF